MFITAIRQALAYQRHHAVEFNIAGAVAGLVTGVIFAVGFFTRSMPTPTAAPHGWGWLTGPLLTFLHEGGNWYLAFASLLGGIAVGVQALVVAVHMRYFFAHRREMRLRHPY